MTNTAIVRAWLRGEVGQTWTPAELAEEFEITHEHKGLAVVRHKISNKIGSVWRTRCGRWYHSYRPD